MIYFKTQLMEGVDVKINVYGDEFYTMCPTCGKEFNVDTEHLKKIDLDFAGTVCFCRDCSDDKVVVDDFMNDLENGRVLNSNRISVKVAAKLLRTSEQFIRIGLQRDLLPIGTAIQISNNQYTYHISPKLLKDYLGEQGITKYDR